MKKLPLKLEKRLQRRKEEDSFRIILPFSAGVDFFSNDYLGFAGSEMIFKEAEKLFQDFELKNGSTGSRLLSGNHPAFRIAEEEIAGFHNAEAALIYNSGYDANLGFFSSVPQKDDIILYDEFAHASIRDGLKMSLARNFKYLHNDLSDLKIKLKRFRKKFSDAEIYIITESVFSMDGDTPDLLQIIEIAEKYNAALIVDEAHATGVIGDTGEGLVQKKGLEERVLARIITFGKALGAHGAAILGSDALRNYLINFSRSFIYTTALSPHTVATIRAAYHYLSKDEEALIMLKNNIDLFKAEVKKNDLQHIFIDSQSAIQACVISGNSRVKKVASELQKKGYNVKPILSPTVPAGSERLRFCLHSYNSVQEIRGVLKVLGNFVIKEM
ncbi:MAG: aminotransferase class I/II-fold pyridoxal phosphate-dependent enzyme [Gramella sp.]|nr:aminotransferase class I/II-fold pyridoxal phosphate-dependent enzyme [Christiangramia sp.]